VGTEKNINGEGCKSNSSIGNLGWTLIVVATNLSRWEGVNLNPEKCGPPKII
jgi:hypothetical protein